MWLDLEEVGSLKSPLLDEGSYWGWRVESEQHALPIVDDIWKQKNMKRLINFAAGNHSVESEKNH